MPDAERCAHRAEVVELLAFIGERPTLFWEVFADEMKRRDLLQADSVEVNDREFTIEQGQEYHNSICPFKQYAGQPYNNVPFEYLAWIADKNADLARYLRWRERYVTE